MAARPREGRFVDEIEDGKEFSRNHLFVYEKTEPGGEVLTAPPEHRVIAAPVRIDRESHSKRRSPPIRQVPSGFRCGTTESYGVAIIEALLIRNLEIVGQCSGRKPKLIGDDIA